MDVGVNLDDIFVDMCARKLYYMSMVMRVGDGLFVYI